MKTNRVELEWWNEEEEETEVEKWKDMENERKKAKRRVQQILGEMKKESEDARPMSWMPTSTEIDLIS